MRRVTAYWRFLKVVELLRGVVTVANRTPQIWHLITET